MKAYIRFDLPEDNNEYLMANNGINYFGSLCDIANVCRAILRHDIKPKPKDIQHIQEIIMNTTGFHEVQ